LLYGISWFRTNPSYIKPLRVHRAYRSEEKQISSSSSYQIEGVYQKQKELFVADSWDILSNEMPLLDDLLL
jgi:hypothetical protein